MTSDDTIIDYPSDQMNSSRMLLTAGGWPVSQDIYYPFGDGPYPAADQNHYKFTGKERDTESGNDYFGARYYVSSMGRFLSPDWSAKVEPVPYAKLVNPQSLNLYAYAGNNPMGAADPDGHDAFAAVDTPDMGSVKSMFDGTSPVDEADDVAAQQQQSTLPNDPSGLGSDWKDVTPTPGGKVNPDIPKRFRGPDGTQIEYDAPNPGKRPGTSAGDGGWHVLGPDGKRIRTGPNSHLDPGDKIPTQADLAPQSDSGATKMTISPKAAQNAVKTGAWTAAGAIAIRTIIIMGEAAAAF